MAETLSVRMCLYATATTAITNARSNVGDDGVPVLRDKPTQSVNGSRRRRPTYAKGKRLKVSTLQRIKHSIWIIILIKKTVTVMVLMMQISATTTILYMPKATHLNKVENLAPYTTHSPESTGDGIHRDNNTNIKYTRNILNIKNIQSNNIQQRRTTKPQPKHFLHPPCRVLRRAARQEESRLHQDGALPVGCRLVQADTECQPRLVWGRRLIDDCWVPRMVAPCDCAD